MKAPIAWIFIGAFFAVAIAFMVAPTAVLAVQSVYGEDGFTWQYIASLGEYRYRVAFMNSLILSVGSATIGVIAGGLIAHAVLKPGSPDWLRSAVTSFSAVAANFAGVPLAFAFISTLGSLGLLTTLLKQANIDIYGLGFSLYSLPGLMLVYSYFQVPLMVIIVTPAIQALRPSWREAADNLGASGGQYWRMVGLPVLMPSLLAGWILLFGSAFSAYATAYALTSGNIGLVTTEISNVLSGNVMASPQTGAALSVGMIVVMVGVLLLSALLSRQAARWAPRR
ncbi:MAG TPA: ABC transporter permease subunit [Stellaceae bacterium]|nr:ABC transporter permease subunit [Stellaceae bacterium]